MDGCDKHVLYICNISVRRACDYSMMDLYVGTCIHACNLIAASHADSWIQASNCTDSMAYHISLMTLKTYSGRTAVKICTNRQTCSATPSCTDSGLAGHFRPKRSVQTDVTMSLSVCLIVYAHVSVRGSMMPFVLLCMTHASVDSRHVVPHASMYKKKTDKNKLLFCVSFEEQHSYGDNSVCVVFQVLAKPYQQQSPGRGCDAATCARSCSLGCSW